MVVVTMILVNLWANDLWIAHSNIDWSLVLYSLRYSIRQLRLLCFEMCKEQKTIINSEGQRKKETFSKIRAVWNSVIKWSFWCGDKLSITIFAWNFYIVLLRFSIFPIIFCIRSHQWTWVLPVIKWSVYSGRKVLYE